MLRATSRAVTQTIPFTRRIARLPLADTSKHVLRSFSAAMTRTASTLPAPSVTHPPATPWSNTAQLTRSDAQKQTIYALSTPPGKGGVAVVRISGPEALEVWRKMVKPYKTKSQPTPWKLERCRIVHPDNQDEVIDDGLSVFFEGESIYALYSVLVVLIRIAAPKSFTTESTLELHTHSGRALLTTLLGALSRLPFLRPAEPGEFTKRAFLNGRLDLTEVEGLADLIDAETEEQRKVAGRGAWVGKTQCYATSFNVY